MCILSTFAWKSQTKIWNENWLFVICCEIWNAGCIFFENFYGGRVLQLIAMNSRYLAIGKLGFKNMQRKNQAFVVSSWYFSGWILAYFDNFHTCPHDFLQRQYFGSQRSEHDKQKPSKQFFILLTSLYQFFKFQQTISKYRLWSYWKLSIVEG